MSEKPLVEVDENHTFVLTKVLNMKYLLKIWWLIVWFFKAIPQNPTEIFPGDVVSLSDFTDSIEAGRYL